MKISSEIQREQKSLWKYEVNEKYQEHVTIIGSTDDEKAVYIEDFEKRKEAYGICGECNEPGTGWYWCQPCNAKRFEENFKNWTSGNQDIDEFIQHSQLSAVCYTKKFEWIPFENFQNITYITRGGFGKIYSAKWPEGYICYWDIKNQEWARSSAGAKVALKSLDNSSNNISTDFLNEGKSHLQIYLFDVIRCYGITQDPNTKDYMMVLQYCDDGNLRNYLNKNKLDYYSKVDKLRQIARGLLDIHNAEKVHKDLHSGNILLFDGFSYISDLGMCQPANNEEKSKGIYGVLPYIAPEVLRGHQYTKASDIYSFGIIMNEFVSEETPYNETPHDHVLAVNICKGLRPKISENSPKLFTDLIMKCWDAKAENRPTAKELFEVLNKWNKEKWNNYSEISSQIQECKKIKKSKLKNNSNKNNKSKNSIQTHPQAIYTSRLLIFKNLPEPVNSSNLLSSFQFNSVSECFDCSIE